jgi:uncharacterized protein
MSRYPWFPWTAIVLTLFAGCATSPASKFYTLSPVQVVEQSSSTNPVTIAIDPVTVPELVDRSQIVTALDANRVSIDEFARWAEPLKGQIPRVLAQLSLFALRRDGFSPISDTAAAVTR